MTSNYHEIAKALIAAAEFGGDATHELKAAGIIIDPQTMQPAQEGRPRVLTPDFPVLPQPQHMAVIIDPNNDDEAGDDAAERPLITDVPEPQLVIIPTRSEYDLNNDELRRIEREHGAVLGW